MTIAVNTNEKRQVIDITDQIGAHLQGSGLVSIFIKHTTAAITAADLDPGTDEDILTAIKAMTPDHKWKHPHDPDHFPDHLWAAIIGPGIVVPFAGGKLQLGNWQRLILLEFDGPRKRQLEIDLINAS